MSATQAKRTIYDSVFTDLFRDTKNQLRLYRDLHPEDTDVTAGDIRNVTLRPILTDQLYNDLGFSVRERTILLIEAQSRWCPNMALRSLIYLSDTYMKYIEKSGQDIYSTKTARIPKPELYVLYTGESEHSEKEISLAEVFWDGDDSVVDVRVKVIYGDGSDAILSQYSAFTRIYRKYRKMHGPTKEAVEATINECISRDILKEYLESRRAEVIDMMSFLFDDDKIQELHERSIRREAREEGREEAQYQDVGKLVADGIYDAQRACEILGVDIEAYKAYQNKMNEETMQ